MSMALILVIDDSIELRRAVRRILLSAGHDVLEAENGNIGLALVNEHEPALVITDLIMPDKEGIETILDIRRRGKPTPILAISGSDPAPASIYLGAASKLGADHVMRKPFRAAELLAAVERLLAPT